MDISGISSTHSATQIESQRSEKSEEAHKHHHDHRGRSHGRSARPRALGVFSQELRVAFEARFRAKFAISFPGYTQHQEDQDPSEVARETLGAARQLVSEAPVNSAKALISFRAIVHETASFVRETLGSQDDLPEVDDALARVDTGLDELQNDVARNQESVATALQIDTQSKQRSTIKIRTQEGDIVKLSIRRSDSLSAYDTATIEGGETSSTTEIEISSRSRLTLSVNGDLNDDELLAIQNVFAQAESIANQFFGGDLAAAFELAAGFEFDTEQLARVNLRFRSFQSSSIAYAETTTAAAPALSASTPVPEPAVSTVAPVANTSIVAATPVATQIEPIVETPISPPAPSLIDTSAFSELFDLLSDFLRSVGEGFEGLGDSSATSIRFHYSESFKLTLLSAVINAVAPAESDEAASAASSIIDSIAGVSDQENEVTQ